MEMAENLLMKKGLDSIFNPEQKYENEAKFGKHLLYVAWAIEILATIIGLAISVATARAAYFAVQNPDSGTLTNAIIGALPFLIIAVVEPTKKPLAGGLYKVRTLHWKVLILISLLGLTAVTFETMFNGLERNLNNVTQLVTDSKNIISAKENEKEALLEEQHSLENESEEEATTALQQARLQGQQSYETNQKNLKAAYDPQIQAKKDTISSLKLEQTQLVQTELSANDPELRGLKDKISGLTEGIQELKEQKSAEI